jgi:5-methylcytosine-specific restriction endonuclease McrA
MAGSKASTNKKRWKELSAKLRQDAGCAICDEREHLQVHHIVAKFYKKSLLRFEEANLIVLCPRHHFAFHKDPVTTMAWFQKHRKYDYDKILNMLGNL